MDQKQTFITDEATVLTNNEERAAALREVAALADPNSCVLLALSKDKKRLLCYTVIESEEDFKRMIGTLMQDGTVQMQIAAVTDILNKLVTSAAMNKVMAGREN